MFARPVAAGFVAIDIAKALDMRLFDPDAKSAPIEFTAGQHSSKANGLIARIQFHPTSWSRNGGADLVYFPKANAKDLAVKIVDMLLGQDYVSGLLSMMRSAASPELCPERDQFQRIGSHTTAAIVINFRSFVAGCGEPLMCGVTVADHTLQQGQGMHGSFSRADTSNFMAAIGPSFRSRFVDPARRATPISA